MQGLIYNLLANLAQKADCQEEAWEIALQAAYCDETSARDPEGEELLALDDEALFEMPGFGQGGGFKGGT